MYEAGETPAPRPTLREHAVEAGGFERAFEMLDRRPATRRPGDSDDVETGTAFEQVVPLHVGESEARQPSLLGFIDGVGRMTGVVRGACLDLDEDHRAAIDGDKIKLADVIAMAASDDDVAEPAQVTGGGVFAA